MTDGFTHSLGAARFLEKGMRVFVEAGVGEPIAFQEMLLADPARAAGVTFAGVFIPGLNSFDYAGLDPEARSEATFFLPPFRESIEAGRCLVRPMHYYATARWLARQDFDIAVVHLSPPDTDGICSFGISADFAPIGAARARRIVGYINERMPRSRGEPGLRFADLSLAIPVSTPLPTFPAGPTDAVSAAIAGHVAGLVRDGDTLQIGIGKMPAAALGALRNHCNLRFFSGMIIDEVAELADAGALADPQHGRAPVVTGCAIGTARVHEFAGRTEWVSLRNVLHTHAPDVLRGIDNFVSINGALSVDLFGQVNGEMLGGRRVSGVGGMTDFVRGARASRGGRSILALPAVAGRHTRIVPLLEGGPVTVSRADVDWIVTEHGAVQLRDLDTDARAEALIGIAAPEHRDSLAVAWRDLRLRI
jgi:acyl-CoA hydrolase